MKVTVFGGAGFIGSRVASCLLKYGHQVVALVRDEPKGAELARLGAEVRIGDLRDREEMQRAMMGADIVINVAIPSYRGRVGLARVREIAGQHLENIKNILDAAKRVGDLPVVISEGTLVWGDGGDAWLDERSELRPLGMGRVGELVVPHVQRMIEEKGAPIIRISPCAVYGAGSWFESKVYAFMERGWFRTFGDGQNVMSFVYVDDLAEAYRLAVEKRPIGELFAIAEDHPVRFRDFANCVARAMGKRPVKSMPRWIGSILAGQAMVETLTINHKVRNTKAKKELGWHPMHACCEQGVPKAVAAIESSRHR